MMLERQPKDEKNIHLEAKQEKRARSTRVGGEDECSYPYCFCRLDSLNRLVVPSFLTQLGLYS